MHGVNDANDEVNHGVSETAKRNTKSQANGYIGEGESVSRRPNKRLNRDTDNQPHNNITLKNQN